ncbi:MAG: hypothetical protein ACXU9X_10770, partial [Thermodesulfobacteriota bacterium]
MEKKETTGQKIKQANQIAIERMLAAQPVWVDVGRAGDVIPGMTKNMLLHAGPPQKYENMCGPQRGAAWGALIYEGLAKDAQEADRLVSLQRVHKLAAADGVA